MGLKEWFKTKFFTGSTLITEDVTPRPVGKAIVTSLISAIQKISNFDNRNIYDSFENMYAYSPEVGGAIDRFSSLVALSYKGFYLQHTGEEATEQDKKLLELANKLDEHYNLREMFEVLSELLLMYGNVFIHVKKGKNGFPQLRILPNKYVTIVDDRDKVNKIDVIKTMTKAKYYVVNEGKINPSMPIEIIPADQIIHIKYKNTPIFWADKFGRPTYGLYSISPLMRTIFPEMWKRQTMITDILWRYRNVPREHHVVSSNSFNLQNYTGTLQERLQKAKADAEKMIAEYAEMIQSQEPDQGYVTLDNITIKRIDSSAGKYAEPNQLIQQMTDYIWMALNIPESVVSGKSKGSYASELVVSSYLTAKVIRIAEKIKGALITFVRDTIKAIDDSLPVKNLDIKIELIMDTNRMELFRQAAIMADLGVFTPDEIRKMLGYPELRGDPLIRDKTKKIGSKSVGDVVADEMRKTGGSEYPITPQSNEDKLKPEV